jgi:hypothetical protein
MGITRVEVCGRLALACAGCGEIILFLGRERDWYEPGAEGRPKCFMCGGCGAQLTLANRVVEAPRKLRNSGSLPYIEPARENSSPPIIVSVSRPEDRILIVENSRFSASVSTLICHSLSDT